MGSAAFTTTRWQLNSKCKKTTAEKKDEEIHLMWILKLLLTIRNK